MRKTVLQAPPVPGPVVDESRDAWLDLSTAASVEVTSEDTGCPVENALDCNAPGRWRADGPGDQRITLIFDGPVPVHRIQLRFTETAVERTQEFALHWYDAEGTPRLIVRQQWNFSPAGSTLELEDYRVNLNAVSKLELAIRPGLQPGPIASLDCWRVA
jgi:hypothetical protein